MMDSNYLLRLAILFLILSTVSCIRSNKEIGKPVNNQVEYDSFKVGSAMKSHTIIGKRIYPINDNSAAYSNATKTGVFLCLNVNNTLFVLLNNNILCNNNLINDSLLENYFSKYYIIEHEDDLPYFVYIHNKNDTITLIKNKKTAEYTLENAIINDTIFTIESTIKVGYTKSEFMDKLGIKMLDSIPNNILLIPISIVNTTWFTKYLNKDDINFISQAKCNDFFSIEIKFEKDKIYQFKLGNWFGEWW